MATIKISSQVERAEWSALQDIARESHQSISGLLTEAIRDYVRRRRVRPVVMDHLETSMDENEELGRRLAE
jgi:predicted transcriptional regulator